MSSARAARVLEDEAFLSTELVSTLKGAEVNPFTPDYEQRSYRAWRYIFGTLSYWDGPEKYGDTVLRLKPAAWRRRAWATRRSAMKALAVTAEKAGTGIEKAALDPELAKEADSLFASWITVPRDLPRSVSLQILGELRLLPAEVFAEFLKAPKKDLPGLIREHDVGWLAGGQAPGIGAGGRYRIDKDPRRAAGGYFRPGRQARDPGFLRGQVKRAKAFRRAKPAVFLYD